MINPQAIDLAALPWLPLNAKTAFPRQPAIYFAIDSQNQIQYIGQSTDPKHRWERHHRYQELEEIGGVRVAYLFVDDAELLPEIETSLIVWFKPPLNRTGLCLENQQQKSTSPRVGMRQLRERAGLTILDVAKQLDCAESSIRNWEKGRSVPKMEVWQVFRMRDLYQCTEDDLKQAAEKSQQQGQA